MMRGMVLGAMLLLSACVTTRRGGEPALATLSPPKGVAASPFGMNIHFGNRYTQEEMVRAAKMARAVGIRWNREEFSWHLIEPQKGTWDWNRYDLAVRAACEQEIQSFGLLAYVAPWASSGPETEPYRERQLYLPRDLGDFENYCYQVVSRYKGLIQYWQIWNEPNIPGFWQPKPNPAEYTRLLEAGRRGVRRADPNAVVLGLALSMFDFQFLEEVLKCGGGDFCDVLTIHPYRISPDINIHSQVAELRALMRQYGVQDKPVWYTEGGWFTATGTGVSEETQADYLVRFYVLALAGGIEKIFWYNYRNDSSNDSDKESTFGIVRHDFAPKTAYHAYGRMTAKLEGLHYSRSVGGEDQEIHQFTGRSAKNQREVWVAWTAKEKGAAAIPLAAGAARITSLLGEERTVKTSHGVLNVELTGSPLYIEPLR